MATTSHTHTPAGHVPVRRRRRAPLRIAGAVAAGVVVATAISASAANLGTVTTPSLGATTSIVGSCDTDGVTVTYTTSYSATNGQYNLATVGLSGIAGACNGRTLGITLTGAGNAALGTIAITGGSVLTGLPASAPSATPAVPDTGTATATVSGVVTAASVTGIAIVIG